MKQSNIICFGEMLWDMLPAGKQAGGAPMNVAVHLKNLGLNPLIISRVGNDELGEELIHFVTNHGLSTDFIQLGKTHLTGVAKANVSDKNEVTYKLVHPVAWDYITCNEDLEKAVERADVFVFGSLIARSQESSETLHYLLSKAKFKVFDVNLRSPFYEQATVESLLRKADMVKMNANELALISDWNEGVLEEKSAMLSIAKRFNINTICVTRGEKGAILFINGDFYEHAGFEVEVIDTIGSGDSFLAALLTGLLANNNPAESLEFACAMGSLVATYQGATPYVTYSDVQSFLNKNTIEILSHNTHTN
jgi:fructokinase